MRVATTIRLLLRPRPIPFHIRTVMSKAPKPQTTRSAICNCKQVEISVTGVDKGAVLCHCSNCQKASGSAFAHNHRLFPSELQIVKGNDLVKQYQDRDTKSGNTLNRHFCSNCVRSNPTFPMSVRCSTYKDAHFMSQALGTYAYRFTGLPFVHDQPHHQGVCRPT